MSNNVTAIYRTFATADLVRRELTDLGISAGRVRLVPDRDEPVTAGQHRDDNRYTDQLHDLHLPDDDVRTYQQSVRRGDYVVSVEVDDDAHLSRVKEIMRRPEAEAHHIGDRETEFRDEPVMPYSSTERRRNDDWMGERDTADDDAYTRSYRRKQPLDQRYD